jgi:anaerobic ribonucleoside-triphosphate reductase|tara:strand:+ start:23 stop:481 length:459 start_codon:yes stop_codon:yes gene_type:complete
MSWQTAVVGATGLVQYRQQGTIGKYNEDVMNRKAAVLETQAEAIEKKAEFDIAQFDKKFEQIEGDTKVELAKSGVVQGIGTGYRIQLANRMEAELQRKLIEYNAKVEADRKLEEARFARISGQIVRQQTKLAQINTIASTGTTLLTMNKGTA